MAVNNRERPFPIRPDCSTSREALRRVFNKWGIDEGFGRFKSLLISGKLNAYASNNLGQLAKFLPNVWTSAFLKDDDLCPRWRDSITVFLTSELDAVLPTVEEQAEQDRSPVASGSG
jgi:hypothetical protein